MNSITPEQSWTRSFFKYGHFAKGFIYLVVGGLAMATVIGASRGPAGPKDVIGFLQDQAFGQILLFLLGLGLLSYCAWRWIKAVKDPKNEGSDGSGIVKRIGYASSGTFYGILSILAFRAVFMGGSGGSSSSKQDIIAEILSQSWGQAVVFILAAIILGVGIYQLYRGLSEKFLEDVNLSHVDSDKYEFYKGFGKAGHVARAVTFSIISYFLFLAALRSDPSSVRGLEGALEFLQNNSYGVWLLAIVALGMICYGIFMFLKAKYGNIGSSSRSTEYSGSLA